MKHKFTKMFALATAIIGATITPILSSCSFDVKPTTGVNKWVATSWVDKGRGNVWEVSYNTALKECKANSIIVGDQYTSTKEEPQGHVFIPAVLKFDNTSCKVTEINNVKLGKYAKKIKYLDFGSATNLKKIGPSCFEGLKIENVDWTGLTSLEEIGDKAFKNIHMDASQELSANNMIDFSNTRLKRIGNEAFYGMGSWQELKEKGFQANAWNFVFPETLEEIGERAFNGDQVKEKVSGWDIATLVLGVISVASGIVTLSKSVSGLVKSNKILREIKQLGVSGIDGTLYNIAGMPLLKTVEKSTGKVKKIRFLLDQEFEHFTDDYPTLTFKRDMDTIPALDANGKQIVIDGIEMHEVKMYDRQDPANILVPENWNELSNSQKNQFTLNRMKLSKVNQMSSKNAWRLMNSEDSFLEIGWKPIFDGGQPFFSTQEEWDSWKQNSKPQYEELLTLYDEDKQILDAQGLNEMFEQMKISTPPGQSSWPLEAEIKKLMDKHKDFHPYSNNRTDLFNLEDRRSKLTDVIGFKFSSAEYERSVQRTAHTMHDNSVMGIFGGVAALASGIPMVSIAATNIARANKTYKDDSPNCVGMFFLGNKPPKLGKNWAPRMLEKDMFGVGSEIYVPAENGNKINLNCNSETQSSILNSYINNTNSFYEEKGEKRELKKDKYHTSLISYDETNTQHNIVGYSCASGSFQPGWKLNYPRDQLKTTSPKFTSKLTGDQYIKGIGIPRYSPMFSLKRCDSNAIQINPSTGAISWDSTLAPGTYHFNIMTTLYEHKEDPNNPGYALGEEYFSPAGYAISKDMTLTIKPLEDTIRLDMRDVYYGNHNESNSDGVETNYKVTYAGVDESEFDDEEYHLGSLKLKLVGAPDGVELKNGKIYWTKPLPKGVYHFSVVAERHEPYSRYSLEKDDMHYWNIRHTAEKPVTLVIN